MTQSEILLFRHGKVDFDGRKWVGARELAHEVHRYNTAPLQSWDVRNEDRLPEFVFCSTLRRSIDSAMHMFGRVDIIDPVFREAELPQLPALPIKLPVQSLFVTARCLWLCGASRDCEQLPYFKARIQAAADILIKTSTEKKTVALVGHGVLNRFLGKEFRRRGLSASCRSNARHGGVAKFTL